MEGRESNRLEAFSDAVFAISITLLGLDLKLPIKDDKVSFMWALLEQWPVYLAFFVSFLTLLMMWYIHSVYFRFLYKINREVFYANGFILMFTVSIPFVTRMVVEYMSKNSGDIAIRIYTGFGPLISLSYFWLIDAIKRAKKDQNPDISKEEIKKVWRKISFGPPAYTLSFILSFFMPYLALVICSGTNLYWAFTKLRFDTETVGPVKSESSEE